MEDAEENSATLSPLITTAVKASEPGDTVILCPTSILFSIPLHAIPVNDKPFIERNPVVYAQSLSILRICAISTSSLTGYIPADPLAVQALSDAECSLPSVPTTAFAHKIAARLLSGAELTKASFLEAITQSSLIHFYGHVNFDEKKPLDHHLGIKGIPNQRVTARNLFNIRLRSVAHVNLIACKSGKSEVRVNDDQLGLSTALLYAGAGSMISALWKIRKKDAHESQEVFYDDIMAQVSSEEEDRIEGERQGGGKSKERFLDMAKVLQKAMLMVSVDGEGKRRKPYHWAAFMLQGNRLALRILSLRRSQGAQ